MWETTFWWTENTIGTTYNTYPVGFPVKPCRVSGACSLYWKDYYIVFPVKAASTSPECCFAYPEQLLENG